VQNGIGIQIMELNPICEKKPAEEFMRGKRKPSENESKEEYPESSGWPRDDFWSADADIHRVILQNADLHGILQISLQKLGLDPVAHGGRFGISDLGARLGLLSSSRSGVGSARSSLAHGGSARAGALTERE
jgi:hypothetical protein